MHFERLAPKFFALWKVRIASLSCYLQNLMFPLKFPYLEGWVELYLHGGKLRRQDFLSTKRISLAFKVHPGFHLHYTREITPEFRLKILNKADYNSFSDLLSA